MTHRATLARRAGCLRDAEADARAALEALLDPQWSFARGVVPLAGSLLDQGRPEDARDELAAALGDAELTDAPPLTPLVLVRMAINVARGDHAAALRDWQDALRRASRLRGVNAGWMEDLEIAVGVYDAVGDRAEAKATAVQALDLARAWDTPGALGHARVAQARIAASVQPRRSSAAARSWTSTSAARTGRSSWTSAVQRRATDHRRALRGRMSLRSALVAVIALATVAFVIGTAIERNSGESRGAEKAGETAHHEGGAESRHAEGGWRAGQRREQAGSSAGGASQRADPARDRHRGRPLRRPRGAGR